VIGIEGVISNIRFLVPAYARPETPERDLLLSVRDRYEETLRITTSNNGISISTVSREKVQLRRVTTQCMIVMNRASAPKRVRKSEHGVTILFSPSMLGSYVKYHLLSVSPHLNQNYSVSTLTRMS
jgi:hypothetical protein